MSDLGIAERQKPQDGKIDFSRFGDLPMELRVVTVPTAHGVEQVVLRLLSGARPLPIDGIGLSPANLVTLKERIHKPYGLILICGPTGCGKTTTLHSVLRELNQGAPRSGRPKTPSRSPSRACARCRSMPASAGPSRLRCAPSCAPTPTSS
ncbi:MAG: ATPase, T2SS/T4P/T4SS family [Aquabacterium sp.]